MLHEKVFVMIISTIWGNYLWFALYICENNSTIKIEPNVGKN